MRQVESSPCRHCIRTNMLRKAEIVSSRLMGFDHPRTLNRLLLVCFADRVRVNLSTLWLVRSATTCTRDFVVVLEPVQVRQQVISRCSPRVRTVAVAVSTYTCCSAVFDHDSTKVCWNFYHLEYNSDCTRTVTREYDLARCYCCQLCSLTTAAAAACTTLW